MKIGILAVQGDFAAHAAMLASMGVESVEVRTRQDLAGCDGLILPETTIRIAASVRRSTLSGTRTAP